MGKKFDQKTYDKLCRKVRFILESKNQKMIECMIVHLKVWIGYVARYPEQSTNRQAVTESILNNLQPAVNTQPEKKDIETETRIVTHEELKAFRSEFEKTERRAEQ